MSKFIGDVSAYAYAVSKGYTGTEEEFAELMASYADVGQTAVDAAESALNSKTAAQTAATTATNKASEATTAATTATTKAGEASQSASQASASATTASTKASEASQSASTASAKATEATTAATSANTAKTDAVAAKTAAETAQGKAEDAQAAAEDAAESVSASAAQIAQNTSDITDKAPVILESASGNIASFTDGSDMPMKSLVAKIEPVQSGSGDPSPDNVRPISGWTGVTVHRADGESPHVVDDTFSVDWQSEAGTVYGGTLDVINGELVVDRAVVTLDGTHYTLGGRNAFTNVARYYVNQNIQLRARGRDSLVMADRATPSYDATVGISNNTPTGYYIWVYGSDTVFITLPVDVASSNAEATTWLVEHPIQFVYELATPITYQLTPHEVKSLLGQNHVWADTGNVDVEYRADTKLYIQRLTQPDTADLIADANITSGQYFMVGNSLYKATANIASGAIISPNVNCTRKSLSEALNELNA